MRKILRGIQLAFGFAAALAEIVILQPPKDLIAAARSCLIDVGLTPPLWLDGSHERQIMRVALRVAVLIISILLLWPLISQFSLWIHRLLREFTTIEQIAKKIPTKYIAHDGEWGARAEAINARLQRFNGRTAKLNVTVGVVEPTPEGRYAWVLRVHARSPDNNRTSLKVLLYIYFDGADADLIRRVRTHTKDDPMDIRGRITRLDVHNYDGVGWCLNIDLHGCLILN